MSFGFVAFHYPAPEHFEEFVEGCHEVIAAGRAQPGFERADVWVTPDGEAVVTIASFESEEAFQAAAEAIGPQSEEQEIKPRQIHFLQSR
ncbi:antibiotic biosynthesis monooxygenase [Herbihabitans rhizosphaerae]|uniref:Antibiotic biosynthesis monooxygenase n=1 Tax=Herbihabitans rhizosphaerae TaxID=1872711 RepID=A0A4Q7KGM4_9PSEU|nr:antibiotic biosynthesis monooxygenase [Herbihabitans rhizosphaerae]RZS32397.1 antibiotic biosynthesis monooxygenase [Herbihabitans rhizosphaerae]